MSDTVHLIPVPGVWITGVPAVECDVDAETAERLLAHQPAAFVVGTPEPEPAAKPAKSERKAR